jgi:hypothetical protein
MPIANIIGLAVIGAIVLFALVMVIRAKAWGEGYSEGFKDCQKLTESYVNELMKVGEDIDIPNGSSEESTN